jgi:hypothetical protein
MISPASRRSSAFRVDVLLFPLVLGALACEKGTPATAEPKAPLAGTASSLPPESSPEAMRDYARTHLPSGLKPGDFLTGKRDYPTGDTAEVYRAVLDTLYVTNEGKPSLVVLLDVADARVVGCAKVSCPLVPAEHSTRISDATLEAFRQATLTRRHISPGFRYRLPLKLLTEQDRKLTEEDGRYHSIARVEKSNVDHPFWLGFAADYPGAWGYAVMTAVGMNPEKTEAVLQVRHHCGGSCYSFESMVLRKTSGRWQVVERMPELADSLDRGEKYLRYRGVGARKPNAEVRAQAFADSLKIDRLPRDIHGVLTDYPYGGPIVGAAVTAATIEDPNKPWTKVYSDSRGGYVIENPPVGAAAITVRCPHGTVRADGLMAVTGAQVKPGGRVLFNMAIEKRNCDDPTGTPQSIQPPFDAPPLGNAADSARSRKATYPSDEEAAVYRAVLSGFATPPADKIMLLYATTKSQCEGPACAADYYRRIRFEPEVMLSTMENFLSVREKRLDLRYDFTGISNLVLIGDSTLKLLEQAMGRTDLINNWSLIRLAYPAVEKVVQVSPVAFSPHHKQAMVELTRGDIDGLSKGELWIAEKQTDGNWRIVRWFR